MAWRGRGNGRKNLFSHAGCTPIAALTDADTANSDAEHFSGQATQPSWVPRIYERRRRPSAVGIAVIPKSSDVRWRRGREARGCCDTRAPKT